MTKLECKVCGFRSLNLEPHICKAHFADAGFSGLPAGDDRDHQTLKWYITKFEIPEDRVVGEIVHPDLLEDESEISMSASKVASTKPKPKAKTKEGDYVDILGVNIPKRPGVLEFVPRVDTAYFFADHAKDVAQDVLENKPVMLIGHTGTGKTSLVCQIAAQANQPVIRVNMNGQTTIGDFVGLWTVKGGETVWVDGALPMAMRLGAWIVIDEIDFAEPAILAVLNAVIERGGKLVLKEKGHELVEPAEGFRVFATANGVGQMADFRGMYQGTNLMNEAFLDRWRCYLIDYLPPEQEAKVLAAAVRPLIGADGVEHRMNVKIASHLVKVANQVREAFKKEELQCTFSLRRLIDWGEMMLRHRDPVKAAEATIFSKVSKQDALVIKGVIERNLVGNR